MHLVRMTLRRRRLRAASALPFGLYLAPAIWVAWFVQAVVLWP
jgi:prepilin signal peptidase PulO-like enzyme (type II secretory pathway)